MSHQQILREVFGYEQYRGPQQPIVEHMVQGGDALVLISTSGNSRNLLRAAQAARALGVRCIGLLGRDGGPLLALCDDAVVVPSRTTAHIQEAHIFIGHCWCALIEQHLGLGKFARVEACDLADGQPHRIAR